MFSDLTFGSVSFVKSNPSILPPLPSEQKKTEPRPPGIYCCSSPTKSGPPPEPSWAEHIGFRWRYIVEKHEPSKWNVISLYYFTACMWHFSKFMGVIGICNLPTKQTLNCSSLFIETLRVPPRNFLNRGCSMGNLWQIERWAPLVWWRPGVFQFGPYTIRDLFYDFQTEKCQTCDAHDAFSFWGIVLSFWGIWRCKMSYDYILWIQQLSWKKSFPTIGDWSYNVSHLFGWR